MRIWIAVGMLLVSFAAASELAPAAEKQDVIHSGEGSDSGGSPKAASQPPPPVTAVVSNTVQPVGDRQPSKEDAKDTEGWWHNFTTDPIATFTLALVLLTAGLWAATRDLVKGADKNAAKQLRAYVGPGDRRLVGLEDEKDFVTVIEFKNFGQTPAHDVLIYADGFHWPKDEPIPTKNWLERELSEAPSAALIHPGESVFIPVTGDGKRLPDWLRSAIKGGTEVFYIFGFISYRDVFGASQKTEFRYSLTGPDLDVVLHPDGWHPLQVCAEGNNAT